MSVVTLVRGDTVNLIIRFGSQTRLKCASCTRYVKPPMDFDSLVECRCGIAYRNTGPTSWTVERVPA